jgi:hypothetical protein
VRACWERFAAARVELVVADVLPCVLVVRKRNFDVS